MLDVFLSVGFSCRGLSSATDAEGKWDPTEVENCLFSELKEESKDVVQRGFPQIHCYTFADSFKRNSPILVKLILPLQPCWNKRNTYKMYWISNNFFFCNYSFYYH